MRSRTSVHAGASALFLLLTLSCSGGATRSQGSGATPSGGDDGQSASPTQPEGDTRSDARKACDDYIACVSDLDPAAAGDLVDRYGAASACWSGSAADEAACKKACDAGVAQRPECIAVNRNYLALCSLEGGAALIYSADLQFDPVTGGTLDLHQLAGVEVYEPTKTLYDVPTIKLQAANRQGQGDSGPFEYDVDSVHFVVKNISIQRLRAVADGFCSDFHWDATGDGAATNQGRVCAYVPRAVGEDVLSGWPSAIGRCDP